MLTTVGKKGLRPFQKVCYKNRARTRFADEHYFVEYFLTQQGSTQSFVTYRPHALARVGGNFLGAIRIWLGMVFVIRFHRPGNLVFEKEM